MSSPYNATVLLTVRLCDAVRAQNQQLFLAPFLLPMLLVLHLILTYATVAGNLVRLGRAARLSSKTSDGMIPRAMDALTKPQHEWTIVLTKMKEAEVEGEGTAPPAVAAASDRGHTEPLNHEGNAGAVVSSTSRKKAAQSIIRHAPTDCYYVSNSSIYSELNQMTKFDFLGDLDTLSLYSSISVRGMTSLAAICTTISVGLLILTGLRGLFLGAANWTPAVKAEMYALMVAEALFFVSGLFTTAPPEQLRKTNVASAFNVPLTRRFIVQTIHVMGLFPFPLISLWSMIAWCTEAHSRVALPFRIVFATIDGLCVLFFFVCFGRRHLWKTASNAAWLFMSELVGASFCTICIFIREMSEIIRCVDTPENWSAVYWALGGGGLVFVFAMLFLEFYTPHASGDTVVHPRQLRDIADYCAKEAKYAHGDVLINHRFNAAAEYFRQDLRRRMKSPTTRGKNSSRPTLALTQPRAPATRRWIRRSGGTHDSPLSDVRCGCASTG